MVSSAFSGSAGRLSWGSTEVALEGRRSGKEAGGRERGGTEVARRPVDWTEQKTEETAVRYAVRGVSYRPHTRSQSQSVFGTIDNLRPPALDCCHRSTSLSVATEDLPAGVMFLPPNELTEISSADL